MANTSDKRNIVVVDDEAQIARVVSKWQNWFPDLLVTDLRMPRVDTLELCRRVRKESRIHLHGLTILDVPESIA